MSTVFSRRLPFADHRVEEKKSKNFGHEGSFWESPIREKSESISASRALPLSQEN